MQRLRVVIAPAGLCACVTGRPYARFRGTMIVNVARPGYYGPLEAQVRIAGAGQELTAPTNGCGFARFDLLPRGDYSVRVQVGGVELVREHAAVSVETTTTVNLAAPPRVPIPGEPSCIPPKLLSGPLGEEFVPRKQVDHGCTVIRCTITTAGTVQDCQALETVEGATERFMRNVLKLRYTPAVCEGKPKDVSFTFKVHFFPEQSW